ncbi:MAG: T9SS type A sorting domain-containing protein [Dysgonamonadaceae bacterium]|jgi:predicted outer membrane repeat protein|nr:T9SS type A sorting domain-containing protein [Dysgonamonadaceae bacterium]
MRKIQLLSVVFAWIFLQTTSAKDIYLSATGNDANDGLSASTAVKSLTRVNEIIGMEDVIHVSGIIKITDEPDFEIKINDGTQDPPAPENGIYLYHRGYYLRNTLKWAGVTFLGEDPSRDGFSGENRAPLFQLDGSAPLTFKNIKLTKAITNRAATGQYGSDVSAIWAVNTETVFDNCIISENDVARKQESPADPVDGWGDRGAIMIAGGLATFTKCEFTENMAREGGCLYLQGGSVTIEDCYFGYNNCAEINDSKGGVIHTWVHGNNGALYCTIRKSVFEGNTAAKGGAIALLDKVSYTSTSTTLTIDRCSFIGNQATSGQGGAILWDNFMGRQSRDNVTITNSVFYGNNSNDYGGAICVWNVQPNSELTMKNVTLHGNYTNGNVGHGPGLSFMTGYETYLPGNLKKYIYNSIFDGNYANGGETGVAFADLSALYTPEEHPDVFEMKNCYAGNTINMLGRAGIDLENNLINYYLESAYDDAITGFDDPDYYGIQFYTVPLLETSSARTYGDAQYLSGTRDLSGKPWVINEGVCAIGASEVTSAELDEGVEFETAISAPDITGKVILIAVNGRLHCIGAGKASIELYNLMGSKIVSGGNDLSIAGLNTGIYIAKIQIGQATYNQKLFVK